MGTLKTEGLKAKLHLMMKELYPGCKYAVLVNTAEDRDTLDVSTTFAREEFIEILTDLRASLLDGSANERESDASDLKP